MEGRVDLEVEKEGTYFVFANLAPSDALDYWFVDADESDLEAMKEKTLDDTLEQIGHGYFKDEMVEDRSLEDWKGSWKSVSDLPDSGAMDVVFEAKAKSGDKSVEDYKKMYQTGYKTDIDGIEIEGNTFRFKRGDAVTEAEYKYDGYKILDYPKGNRGVRFLFTREGEVEGAPKYIQFSDHNIFPTTPKHFHLYMGEESHEALLKDLDHWPTYYPADMSQDEIIADMLAH